MFRFPEIPAFSTGISKAWNLKRFIRSAQHDRQGLIDIGPRQIYILPTRFGLMFGALVIAMLVGAINYANNLGYLLTFFLGGIGVVTIIHTWRNLLDLQLSIEPVAPVFASQNFEVKFHVTNFLKQPRGAVQLSVKDQQNYVINEIPAGQTCLFSIPLISEERGWLKIDRFVLSTQYPLGLFRAWVYISKPVEILVYPKPADSWSVPRTAVYSLSSQGDKGIGADDFVSHRNYRHSDSPKQIDWKIFAREKGLMTKQFGGDRSERLWLSFDLLSDTPVETVLCKLTRAILDADASNLEYGLKLPGQTIQIAHGDKHKADCLKALALFNRKDLPDG